MRPINILYLDDDPDDAQIFKHYFDRTFRNLNLHCRSEPYDRMELYLPFDAFIVDFRMGEHDGLEVARTIHAEDWTKPIMLLTGHDHLALPGAYFVVDHIASKNDPDDCHGKLLSMLRSVAAQKRGAGR